MTSNASNTGRTLLIACGMLAREVLAIKERWKLDYLDVTCLPAQLHFEPEKIPDAALEAIREAKRAGYTSILMGYADCGTGGLLDRIILEEGVERIDGPHCFAFYQGLTTFAAQADEDMTSFYFTDFLVRNFETFFVEPLGLDRFPELKRDYFRNYERVIYLAQTDDPDLDRRARAAARYLELDYERRLTGFGDLETVLKATRRQK